MIIGQKPANVGGVNDQPYDEDGKFASKEGTSGSPDAEGFVSYKIGTSLATDSALLGALKNAGNITAKQERMIMSMPPTKREEVFRKIRDSLETAAEQSEAKRVYDLAQNDDFTAMATMCKAMVIDSHPQDYQDMFRTFYDEYAGGGTKCFEFLKAWRVGGFDAYQDFVNSNPDYQYAEYGPSDKYTFEKQCKHLSDLASSCTIPKDFSCNRYLDTNWLVAFMGKDWCSKIGPITTDGFGYDNFDPQSTQIETIYEALSKKIAETPRIMRKPDDAVSSVSITNSSHMVNAGDREGNKMYKKILVTYDVPAGTNMFVSSYKGESECLLKPGQKMFIKGVEMVPVALNDGTQANRILLRVGLVRK